MKFMRLSDLKAGSGEKQTLLLPVTSPYPVEMTVICGCRPGKTLVVTAGVPMRTPEVTKGLLGSLGTVFLFNVMHTSSQRF